MDLENQKVLVAGLGKSGMAAYELLKNMGAKRGTCWFCLCGV